MPIFDAQPPFRLLVNSALCWNFLVLHLALCATGVLSDLGNVFGNSPLVLQRQFSSVQLLSHVRLFATPWTATRQASLSITNSWSLFKLTSIELVMPSNHLIFCHSLLLPPSIFPSIRAFSNESALHITWPEYWSFSFNINPSNESLGLISFRMDWLDLLASKGLSRVFSNTTVQKHQFFGFRVMFHFLLGSRNSYLLVET